MLPVLVFMNLYVAHDYYLVAVSPAVAALVGLGPGQLWSGSCGLAGSWRRCRLLAVALASGTVELEPGYWSRIDGGSERPDRPAARARGRLPHGGR